MFTYTESVCVCIQSARTIQWKKNREKNIEINEYTENLFGFIHFWLFFRSTIKYWWEKIIIIFNRFCLFVKLYLWFEVMKLKYYIHSHSLYRSHSMFINVWFWNWNLKNKKNFYSFCKKRKEKSFQFQIRTLRENRMFFSCSHCWNEINFSFLSIFLLEKWILLKLSFFTIFFHFFTIFSVCFSIIIIIDKRHQQEHILPLNWIEKPKSYWYQTYWWWEKILERIREREKPKESRTNE